MTLWNDKRTPPGVLTDTTTGQQIGPPTKRGFASAHEGMRRAAAAGASSYGPPKQSGLRKLAAKLGR